MATITNHLNRQIYLALLAREQKQIWEHARTYNLSGSEQGLRLFVVIS